MKKIFYIILSVVVVSGLFYIFVLGSEVDEPSVVKGNESAQKDISDVSDTTSKEKITVKKGNIVDKNDSSLPESARSDKKEKKSRTKQILEQLISKGEVASKVTGVEESYASSSQTAENIQSQTEIYNNIYDEGIYDNLRKENLTFNNVECRESACKLEFGFDGEDDAENLPEKRLKIYTELRKLKNIKGKTAVSNTYDGTIHYYYY